MVGCCVVRWKVEIFVVMNHWSLEVGTHQNSSKLHPPTLNDDKMVNETAIKLAIADLESQERPNFAATA